MDITVPGLLPLSNSKVQNDVTGDTRIDSEKTLDVKQITTPDSTQQRQGDEMESETIYELRKDQCLTQTLITFSGQDSGLWNCSVPHYNTFKQHLECNLEPECHGGEDEGPHCPYSSPVCNGSVAIGNKCFISLKSSGFMSWPSSSRECRSRGGSLANMKTKQEQDVLNKMYQFEKSPPCVLPFEEAIPLCEFSVTKFTPQMTVVVPVVKSEYILNINSSLYVWCPDGHFTFEFLSCDKRSHCGAQKFPLYCETWMEINDRYVFIAMFVCLDHSNTLHYSLVCDFREDCKDGSDEIFCTREQHCDGFRCLNGQCIGSNKQCDLNRDCWDASDEDCSAFQNWYTNRQGFAEPPAVIDFDQHSNLVPSSMSVPSLQILDLSDNLISWLDMSYFMQFENLRVLRLAGNPLQSLFTGYKANFSALTYLDLSRTLLKTFEDLVMSVYLLVVGTVEEVYRDRTWAVGAVIAVLPFLPFLSQWDLYRQNSVCAPLPVYSDGSVGWPYVFSVTVALNLVLSLTADLCHVGSLLTCISSHTVVDETKKGEKTLARRLTLLLATKTLACLLLGSLALSTYWEKSYPGDLINGLMLLIFPLNASVNPVLYGLGLYREERRKCQRQRLLKVLESRCQKTQETRIFAVKTVH
ncbi:hypothetical protein C0Q70_12338 [Pomacea canaliculata]|uniref:C-type lectin domain-containing protein n=1 Tax=Pomacea canaliculata TaxID=400727 RepID=A0A2T7P198_POMCA|nr:hypothetical protein C0Q70_12338 [Pomacea canaliculata]